MPNSVAGTDNVVPIYNPSSRWQMWNLKEIFFGGAGTKKYVPNLDDYVVNTDTDEVWKVTNLDAITLIPTLTRVQTLNVGTLSNNDILLGVGPGTQADTYRVFIDKSVTPYILAVDARLNVAGSMISKAMIFRGSELTGNAVVISALYDQTGTLLGQAIPLELVSTANNIAVKTVPVCHTLADLPDGEIVTAVFYSDTGNVVSKRQLLVENTSFIRSTDASIKYITGITLESPFLSQTDPRLIQYPLNVPLNGLSLTGVVHYSDGSQIRMPVDGNKFQMFGFERFVSTIVGQKFNIVLKYNITPGEVVYGANSVGTQFISETYRATTMNVVGAFTAKLFGYPVWIDNVNGYRFEWFMYNLDRTTVYRVTPYVSFAANSRAFNPTLYGITQNLSVNVNLRDVNGIFSSYIHTQTIDVTLLGPGTNHMTNWTIGTTPNQNPPYGDNVFAATTFINQNAWTLNLASGSANLQDWLTKVYFNTQPLVDPSRETAPPVPNYFSIVFGSTEVEFPISDWNLTHDISLAMPNNSTLFVKFFFRTPDNDIQLSVAGFSVRQQ